MTKYTDEEIIAYLRTLREGDVLTVVKDLNGEYTKGRQYTVESDEFGDLRVRDNNGFGDWISVGDDCNRCVAEYIREGIFEIPAQSIGYFAIESVIHNGTSDARRKYCVRVTTDEAGYEAIRALEADSVKSETLAQLKAKRDALQAQIDDLEAV